MSDPNQLLNRILSKKNEQKVGLLTEVVGIARELGCIGDIIGRTYEVFDDKGKLIATIKQKPMRLNQYNLLSEELTTLKEIEQKGIQNSKGIGKKRLNKRK